MRIGKMWRWNLWLVAALLPVATNALTEQRGQAPASTMPARQACALEKQILPGNFSYPQVHLTGAGIEIGERRKTLTIAYADIDKVEFSPGAFSHADVLIKLRGKHGMYEFSFLITKYTNDQVQQLQYAIENLAQAAGHGDIVCSDNPADYNHELSDFDTNTSAWRMMAAKPPLSDEVYKDRLLAEDAIKSENLAGAVKYYELGVTADPTWDQGWFNLAVVYSKMNDYFDAALCMKHYVILDPNAPDAQAAKDNVILWEAKAEETAPAAEPAGRGGAVK